MKSSTVLNSKIQEKELLFRHLWSAIYLDIPPMEMQKFCCFSRKTWGLHIIVIIRFSSVTDNLESFLEKRQKCSSCYLPGSAVHQAAFHWAWNGR